MQAGSFIGLGSIKGVFGWEMFNHNVCLAFCSDRDARSRLLMSLILVSKRQHNIWVDSLNSCWDTRLGKNLSKRMSLHLTSLWMITSASFFIFVISCHYVLHELGIVRSETKSSRKNTHLALFFVLTFKVIMHEGRISSLSFLSLSRCLLQLAGDKNCILSPPVLGIIPLQ